MSTRDPLLATYSYISPNFNGLLLGPFCVECMNRRYSLDSFHFHSDVSEECGLPIYLHTKVGGKQYKINELVYLNGSRFPFRFRRLPNDLELLLWDCRSEKCKKQDSQKNSRTEESPVFITPSSSTTSCSTLAVKSSMDCFKTGSGTTTDCPTNSASTSTAKVAVSDSRKENGPTERDVTELPPDPSCQLQKEPSLTNLAVNTGPMCQPTVQPGPSSYNTQPLSKSSLTGTVGNRKYLPLTSPSASLGGPILTKAQFHEKMTAITEQMKVTDLEKFDKKFEAIWLMKMDPYVCCGVALEKPHQMLQHIVLHKKHVEWMFSSKTVTLKDVNEILNKIKEVSKAPLPLRPGCSHLQPVLVATAEKQPPEPETFVVPVGKLETVAVPAGSEKQSSKTEPFAYPVGELPFFRGYKKERCYDIMNKTEVEAQLAVWRPLLTKLIPAVCKFVKVTQMKAPVSLSCSFCNNTQMSPGITIQHSTTPRHIEAVYAADMVFSHSKDLRPLLEIFKEAARLMGYTCPKQPAAKARPVSGVVTPTVMSQPARVVEPSTAMSSTVVFPLLNGYKKKDCQDALTLKEVESSLLLWRPLVETLMSHISQIMKNRSPNFRPDCGICQRKPMNPGGAFQHSVSSLHVSFVYEQGLVFSRSKDLNVALEVFRGAAKLAGLPCPSGQSTVPNQPTTPLPPVAATPLSPAVEDCSIERFTQYNFPLLVGSLYSGDSCRDPISPAELEAELIVWRPVLQTFMIVVREVLEKYNPPKLMGCPFCNTKTILEPGSLLQHSMSSKHVNRVHRAGFVFSRSADVNVVRRILQEVDELARRPLPTPTTQDSKEDSKEIPKAVYRSSEVALRTLSEGDPPFPFLHGYNRVECTDALTKGELDTVIPLLLTALLKVALQVKALPNGGNQAEISRTCVYCDKFKVYISPIACLKHSLLRTHLDKAHSSGVVFSRSKDFAVAVKLIQDWNQLVTDRTASAAVASSDSEPSKCSAEPQMELTVVREKIPERAKVNPVLVSQAIEIAHTEAKRLESIPVQVAAVAGQSTLRRIESEQTESTTVIPDDPPFPFLNGRTVKGCLNVMDKVELDRALAPLRSLVQPLARYIDEGATGDKAKFSRVCVYCNKYKHFASASTCLQHVLTSAHLYKVLSSGAVFSRSEDYAAVHKLLNEARKLSKTTPAAEAQLECAVPIVSRSNPTKPTVNSGVASQAAPVAQSASKPLESRPVQEVNPHMRPPVSSQSGIKHTMLMGNQLFPMLSPSRQDSSQIDRADILTDEDVYRICLNFRTFNPPLEQLCGGTRHPVCKKFEENCAPICQFCNIEVRCICQMVTHFFSEQHCYALLRSVLRFRRTEIMVWTDVVDALMIETTLDRRHAWRTRNCWTNVESPGKPTSSANPETAKEAREEKKDKSGCAIS